MRGKVTTLVGAQHGSEGKGVVAHKMAMDYQAFVRTGAPNAGHSIVHDGVLYKMQTIPCGWVNPDAVLVLGAGALINAKILMREIEQIKLVFPDIEDRIFIDEAAGILEDRHHEEEGGIEGRLHKTMGSTGEGVGAARRDRLARDPDYFRFARDIEYINHMVIPDTAGLLNHIVATKKENVMLEGTQGCGLSLIHGSWPHVTTNDTNSAQLAADAGVPPHWVTNCVLVARTYPIRVAGPSGPMHKEVTWDEMSQRVGRPVVEKTTVTLKERRIGEWDEKLMRQAVTINDPTNVALTFMDYLSPADEGKTRFEDLSDTALDFIHYLERTFDTFVSMIGTGWDEKKGWVCIDRGEG